MDDLDRRVLEMLQSDFPISERPYDILAGKLDISTEALLNRIRRLIADGLIRRIGASMDSRKLGFSSTLAAVRVDAESVEKAAGLIGSYPEVTHSYLRNDDFNIWFTIIAPGRQDIERILAEIRSALSLDAGKMLNLPAKRLFKLDTRFNLPQ